MAITVKQSFERRLRRKGIEFDVKPNDASKLSAQLKGLEFWVWDKAEHERKYNEWIQSDARRPCCYNHSIGLPSKNDIPKPLFDYEKEIFDALQKTKYVWIKKATGLGITEFILRYISWLCLRDDKLKGSYLCIVTGPRIELAITLINRFKSLFSNIKFDDKETVCELNNCRIEAFPSHHLDSMRGLDRVSLILLDEGDFFPIGQQQDARAISERYIAKSDPYIIMVSTPNKPEGLFEEIEREPENQCLYKRLFLPYHRGLGKIYTQAEIDKAHESPQFEREYNLAYIGEQGNVFSHESIERAIELGLKTTEKYTLDYVRQDTYKVLGVDPGFGSSKFGIVVCEFIPGNRHDEETDPTIIRVIYADEFERPDFNTIIQKILKMKDNYVIEKIFIDSNNPEVITPLKRGLGERVDYERYIAEKKSKNKYFDIFKWMDVIPVSFSSVGREMLAHTKACLDKEWIAIHPKFHKLIVSLRTAQATDGSLDKQATVHDDLFDAFRLALQSFH